MVVDSDRIPGTAQHAKGTGEAAAAGRLTSDRKLWIKGQPEEVVGTVEKPAGDFKDAARKATDDPQSEVEQLRAEVERLSREPATPRLDAAANIADRYGEKLDRYLDAIRQRPLTSVGVAAGVGFLIGRLLSGTRYVNRI
jgi:ElaB/YqjD/DUF883 family membrane-anchored ribosome-binding protein